MHTWLLQAMRAGRWRVAPLAADLCARSWGPGCNPTSLLPCVRSSKQRWAGWAAGGPFGIPCSGRLLHWGTEATCHLPMFSHMHACPQHTFSTPALCCESQLAPPSPPCPPGSSRWSSARVGQSHNKLNPFSFLLPGDQPLAKLKEITPIRPRRHPAHSKTCFPLSGVEAEMSASIPESGP